MRAGASSGEASVSNSRRFDVIIVVVPVSTASSTMRNTLTLRAAQAQVQAYVTSVGRRPRSAAGDAAQQKLVPLLASGRLRIDIASFLTAA